jgi:hypothetical protein
LGLGIQPGPEPDEQGEQNQPRAVSSAMDCHRSSSDGPIRVAPSSVP